MAPGPTPSPAAWLIKRFKKTLKISISNHFIAFTLVPPEESLQLLAGQNCRDISLNSFLSLCGCHTERELKALSLPGLDDP